VNMKMLCLCLPLLLAGCAHRGPLPERLRSQVPAAADVSAAPATSPAQAPSRRELLKETDKKPAAAAARAKSAKDDDDFIEVDDKKALKKTWPMLLFIGLVALAAGVL